MLSVVPEGHPGDQAWRLPVWRTLLKLQLVNPAQLEPANALTRQGGFFTSHLVTLGVNPDKVLTAIAIVTGLPSAPRHDVRRPPPGLAEGLDGDRLRALLASPFKKDGDLLHLAFVVPMSKESLAALPPHKACVALESDIRDGLSLLFPKGKPSREGPVAMPEFDPSLLGLPPPPPASKAAAPPPATNKPPSAEQLKAAGLVETFITPREEMLSSLKRLKVPGLVVLGLLVFVKAASFVVDFSRAETEKRGAELRRGIGLASVEAAKAQQRAMRPGGGGVAEAPLPVPTPSGGDTPRAGSVDEVTGALAEVDLLARKKDAARFRESCLRLARELKAFAPMAPTSQQMAAMSNLSSETMVFCESEYLEPPQPAWLELRRKIMSALTGDP